MNVEIEQRRVVAVDQIDRPVVEAARRQQLAEIALIGKAGDLLSRKVGAAGKALDKLQ